MKKCFKCGQEKELSDYYEHRHMSDGHLNKCKECTKADVKERYENVSCDPNWIINERERNRQKYYRLDYREKHKPTPEKKKEIIIRWDENNPGKRAANTIAQNAIRDGKLSKKSCEVCGRSTNVQAHHDDYTKPLEVRWLCIKHHNEYHVKQRELKLIAT